MIKYIKTLQNGGGLITHEDQEVDNLFFSVVFVDNQNMSYIKVQGEEDKINKWVGRVQGEYITEQELSDSIPKPAETRLEKLEQLVADLASLQLGV
ncbi:MAG: hypothetical protein GX896_09155 [Clostridiales bacterium]|nr:hypothetical protein [Clostridiales bacterium]